MATAEFLGIMQKREFNPQQEVSQGKPAPWILLAGMWSNSRSDQETWNYFLLG